MGGGARRGKAGSPRESSLPTLPLSSRRRVEVGVGRRDSCPGWLILCEPRRPRPGRVTRRRAVLQQPGHGCRRPRERVCAGAKGRSAGREGCARLSRSGARPSPGPAAQPVIALRPSPAPSAPNGGWSGRGTEKVRLGVITNPLPEGEEIGIQQRRAAAGRSHLGMESRPPPPSPPPRPPLLSPRITSETTWHSAPASARGFIFN
ncbi:uncharacterized protein LOC129058910 [Pongo abelii]|uniref:uncharacterized protein LOC129058910 n=1 Tax=Pongo abelii TaxID=9601 RepID=UPI0023E77858|nr:uncharacterized protein LOC129058910 [Pongo abelii]